MHRGGLEQIQVHVHRISSELGISLLVLPAALRNQLLTHKAQTSAQPSVAEER